MKGVEVKMSNYKHSKEQLIERLYAVMNEETEKPYEEMDSDLIENCVELILELQGKNFTLSNEEIEERVRNIPFVEVADFKATNKNKRKKINKKKLLLIAAIISAICTMMILSSSENNYEDSKITFNSIQEAPTDVPIHYGNIEFVNRGKCKVYKTRDEFFENENYDVLIPSTLPDGININEIVVPVYYDEICVSFDNFITGYEIWPNTSVHEDIINNFDKIYTDKGTPCYYGDFSADIIQINFEYGGDFYTICGKDKQILMDIINSMEV